MRRKRATRQEMLTRTEKWCPLCQATKSTLDFTTSPARPDGRGNWCRKCQRTKGKEYRLKRPQAKITTDSKQSRQRELAWKKRDPKGFKIAHRRYYLKSEYGLTPEHLRALLKTQYGKCPICKRPLKTLTRYHIDHDHQTQNIRGILCVKCNLLLGYGNDNPTILQSAISYLKGAKK